jgi:hypothetical protein
MAILAGSLGNVLLQLPFDRTPGFAMVADPPGLGVDETGVLFVDQRDRHGGHPARGNPHHTHRRDGAQASGSLVGLPLKPT